MAKICPECGEVNENIASFCRKCGYDFNTEMDNTTRKSSLDIKTSKSNSMNLKFILGFVVIIFILGVFLFSLSGNTNTDNMENITLIKETTYGYGTVYEGTPSYSYYLEGVLKNLPYNVEGYDMKGTFYDENGEYLGEETGYLDIIKESSGKSEPTILASMYSSELVNVSYVELVIIDPDGEIAFNESVDFNMKKMDLSSINEN